MTPDPSTLVQQDLKATQAASIVPAAQAALAGCMDVLAVREAGGRAAGS